jgi:hypothetical protein
MLEAKRLFDRYLFADFSGGGENHQSQANIRLYLAQAKGEPVRLLRDNGRHFSRNVLCDRILNELEQATRRGARVIFGTDHQYAWPYRLREHAGLLPFTWREAISRLSQGSDIDGLPKLDIPCRYCRRFNEFSKRDSFWSPLKNVSISYGISNARPLDGELTRRRLTERAYAIQGNARPKPADAVGGMGEGVVGGQTICGLMLISRLIAENNIAWWPFDGLNIHSQAYAGKHVALEIYPSALRPQDVSQSDDNDAMHSCLYARESDRLGGLARLLNLASLKEDITKSRWLAIQRQIEVEGWILGMNPLDLITMSIQ